MKAAVVSSTLLAIGNRAMDGMEGGSRGESWHWERMMCERVVVEGTRLRVRRYVFFIFGRRLVYLLFACFFSTPLRTFLFSLFTYITFDLGFARAAERNNSFMFGFFNGRVCLLLGELRRYAILENSVLDGMWSVVQVVVAVSLYMGRILGPISSVSYRFDRL